MSDGSTSSKQREEMGLSNFLKNIYLDKRTVQDKPKPLAKVTDGWPSQV